MRRMRSKRSLARHGSLLLGLLLLTAGAALAQLQTGNLYGKVSDQTGAVLPGVTITLDTGEAPQVQVTNAQGEFRFLSLAPAAYKIKAELQGFSPVEYPHIVINVGRNTNIEVTMNSAVEDVITVTSESPLLDEKAIRTGSTVSQTELAKIPTARDPWTILQSTPGVLIDRVNVGGNESGQQSIYTGPGSTQDQSVWSVDGVVITDMAATGSTPSYFDFDAFQEMQISTGGSDSTIATGGVVLNLVTKRGTNEYRGSARYFQAPGSTQSNSSLKTSDLPADQRVNFPGGSNKINKVYDYGGEIGGPIVKDHLWAWGAFGEQNVSVQTLPTVAVPNGLTDKTKLPTWNAKLNAQLTSSNSMTLFAMNNAKQKHGRNAGPTRTLPSAWDQGQFGGKPSVIKAEDTQIFSPNLYLTLLYSHVYGGFFLTPIGGFTPSTPDSFQDHFGVWNNSFLGEQFKRPQTQEKGDASSFFNTGSLSHELKYGAAYRVAESVSNVGWAGSGYILDTSLQSLGTPPGPGENGLYLSRNAVGGVKVKYASAYVQDTLTTGNLTVNLGLRYDHQGGDNLPEVAPANPVVPTLLPAVSYAGGPIGFTYKTWSPRLGLTYALGRDRSTLLRASYSRFADQLSADGNHATFLNPMSNISYYYAFTTNSGNGLVTPGQIDFRSHLGYSSNVDPAHPSQLVSPNRVSSNFSAPKTDEFLVSVEHALLPEFVVGFNLTYRKQTNLQQQDLIVFDAADPNGRVSVRSDYVPGTKPATLPDGTAVSVPFFQLRSGVTTNGGAFLHNGDYETTFKGASLTFNKRLSNRWMLRGNVSYNDWYYNKAGDRPDPTLLEAGGTTDANYVRQGDIVVEGSGNGSGSKANVYINSKWAFAVNGLYQIAPDRPWGFNVAANVTGRQGYPLPFYLLTRLNTTTLAEIGAVNGVQIQYSAADANRLDNIVDVDGRIEKEFTFQDFGLTLGVDCFNLLNESFILQRRARLRTAFVNQGDVFEVLSPRIFRFGARLSFK
jgi:hypothetical protein